MMDLLKSTHTIRSELGPAYKLIKSFDELPSEEVKTKYAKTQMLRDSLSAPSCAACGRKYDDDKKRQIK